MAVDLPGFAMRIVSWLDSTARLALNDLGVRQDVDNSKIKKILGWKPRGLVLMIVAMGNSFIEYGVVTPKR